TRCHGCPLQPSLSSSRPRSPAALCTLSLHDALPISFIDETADVLHGEGWRGRTLVESRFDPNPLRGYTGVSALSVESKRALTDVSPNLVEHALSRLSDDHAKYFEFERRAVEQAGVVPRA